jgi:hypothetical protein
MLVSNDEVRRPVPATYGSSEEDVMSVTWYSRRYAKRCAGCGRAILHVPIFTVAEAATEMWCAACTGRLDLIAHGLPMARLAGLVATVQQAVEAATWHLTVRLAKLAMRLYERAECDATRAVRLPPWMTAPRTIGVVREDAGRWSPRPGHRSAGKA